MKLLFYFTTTRTGQLYLAILPDMVKIATSMIITFTGDILFTLQLLWNNMSLDGPVGQMVNHLVRDAASSNRNDSLFPFLRNFSPYAGHCWANGFAFFPQGNDQESTESMQFNSSLIHWGTITE